MLWANLVVSPLNRRCGVRTTFLLALLAFSTLASALLFGPGDPQSAEAALV